MSASNPSLSQLLPLAAPTQTITPATAVAVSAPQVGAFSTNTNTATLSAAAAAPASIVSGPSGVGGFSTTAAPIAAMPTALNTGQPITVSASSVAGFATNTESVAAPTHTITPASATTVSAPSSVSFVAPTSTNNFAAAAAPPAIVSGPTSVGGFDLGALPVGMPTAITASVPMLMAYPPTPPQPGESATNFASEIATYPTMNQSYFALANQAGDPADWSKYPATQNVDISGYFLDAVGATNLINGTATCALTSDPSGELLVNGQPLPDDASNWSLYPALQNVDVSGYFLDAVGALELINGPGSCVLTTDTSGELLINGQVLPTDAAYWAAFPAIQNVDMSGNSIQNMSSAEFVVGPGVVVLTTDASGYRLYADAETVAYLSDVSSATAAVIQTWSLYPAISNLDMSGNSITDVSSLTLQTGAPSVLTSDASGNLLVNGQLVTAGSGGSAANWSFYPATSGTVNLAGSAVTQATSVSSIADLSMNIGNDFNLTAVNDININGQDTSIIGTGTTQITANPKVVGAYGDVQIDAYGSVVPLGNIGFGGLVEITAHTPVATIYTFTSAVKLSGACITSYAGALTPLASLAGVNYVHGDNNVNITSGLPAVFPNLPLQTYIYGTGTPANGGVKLESSNGVEVPNGTIFYADEIRPYYNPFSVGPPPNLRIGGLARLLYTQYVDMDKVNTIAFDSTGTITQLQVINTTLPLSIQGGQTIATSAGTTATMTGGTGASVIATTGTAALTATAGAAQVSGGTTATMTGATGASVIATTGTAALTATAGAATMTAGTTVGITANNGLMTLTTTGANDINLLPGTSGGVHIFSQNGNPSANPEFKIENQNGNAQGAYQKFYKNSASPANGDQGGVISFHANNSNGVDTEFCEITTYTQNVAAGAEQGYLNIDIASPGLGLLTSAQFLDKGVKPAAIYDGTATRGTSGQILTTTGTGLLWSPLTNVIPSTGMTATYTGTATTTTFYENGSYYNAVIWTAGVGTFTITNLGTNPKLDFLIVGGGGSGGSGSSAGGGRIHGGGGGAGGVVEVYELPVVAATLNNAWTITVGTGGVGAIGGGQSGTQSSIVPPNVPTNPYNLWLANTTLGGVAQPFAGSWVAGGGSYGGSAVAATPPSPAGTVVGYTSIVQSAGSVSITYASVSGSGGGASGGSGGALTSGNAAFANLVGTGPHGGETVRGGGYIGGIATVNDLGGGGGGAREAGMNNLSTLTQALGGVGLRTSFDGTVRRLGGGGSGASSSATINTGDSGLQYGGGASSVPAGQGAAALANTGGGGGGSRNTLAGGAGGSGLVIIRYRS